MEKKIKLLQRGWLLLVGIGYIISGCTEETVYSGDTEYRETVEVICHLHIEELEGDLTTRAGKLNGEWTKEEETEIKDLTVIQFDGDGTDGSVKSVVIRKFQNPELGKLTIGLMQPKEVDKVQFVCFIANAGDAFSNFSGTLDELKNQQITLSENSIRTGKLLMTGNCSGILAAETPLSVLLFHRLAKIRFSYTLDLPQGDTFEPVWLQLLSVSQVTQLETGDSSLPAADAGNFTDGIPVLQDISGGYVWYVPENIRGIGSSTSNSASDKNASHAPDTYCTCILLEGNYHQKSDGKNYKVYYRFYPGADNLNDYNLKGNHVYNVQLGIKGINTSDGRVTTEVWDGMLPGANCYMTAPGSTLTFNPYDSPGAYVSATGWGSYNARMGTKEASHIDHIGVVWQTEKGLIKNMYNLASSGEIRLTTLNKEGNALVAAYDKDDNILWSWHIWITDYSPVVVNGNMSEYAAEAVTGGNVYKFADCVWMDRGIGATTADYNSVTCYSMIFQWGRKDPFVAISDINNTPITIYDANGEVVNVGSIKFTDPGYIFDKVMNQPFRFFYNTSNLWYGSSVVTDLWSEEKTFFDPCPAGWCVPPATILDFFTDANIGISYSKPNGSYLVTNRLYCKQQTGLFWPYGGFRYVDSGKPSGGGRGGVYWLSTSSSNTTSATGKTYGGSYNYIDTGARGHSDGMLVRCVKQKNP